MSDECKCGFDHWPLPCKTYNAADRSLASSLAAPTGSAKITQRQLESILINEGIIDAAAIEDPEGYDGGKTELAMTIVTQQINELISPDAKGSVNPFPGEHMDGGCP